jgi:hypothetical protein
MTPRGNNCWNGPKARCQNTWRHRYTTRRQEMWRRPVPRQVPPVAGTNSIKNDGANKGSFYFYTTLGPLVPCRVNKTLKVVAPWFEPLTRRASSSSPTRLFFPFAAAPAVASVRRPAPATQVPSHPHRRTRESPPSPSGACLRPARSGRRRPPHVRRGRPLRRGSRWDLSLSFFFAMPELWNQSSNFISCTTIQSSNQWL